MVTVSLDSVWNETLNCLPDFIAVSSSAAIGVLVKQPRCSQVWIWRSVTLPSST